MSVLGRILSPVRWLVRLELGIWRSLFLWLRRRVAGQAPGVATFSYARQVAPIIGAFIFVSVIELPVVHLLLPWETVRLAALVLSVWGLLWMVGLLASMKVFPHLLDDAGIRIRYGTTVDIAVPWDAIASVRSRRGHAPTGKSVQVERDDDGATLSVPVMKQTRVDLVLHGPTALRLPGGAERVDRVCLYADDAAGLVAAARERLAATQPAPPSASSTRTTPR